MFLLLLQLEKSQIETQITEIFLASFSHFCFGLFHFACCYLLLLPCFACTTVCCVPAPMNVNIGRPQNKILYTFRFVFFANQLKCIFCNNLCQRQQKSQRNNKKMLCIYIFICGWACRFLSFLFGCFLKLLFNFSIFLKLKKRLSICKALFYLVSFFVIIFLIIISYSYAFYV